MDEYCFANFQIGERNGEHPQTGQGVQRRDQEEAALDAFLSQCIAENGDVPTLVPRAPPPSGVDDSTVADAEEEYEQYEAWVLIEDTSDVSKAQEPTWKTKAGAKQ